MKTQARLLTLIALLLPAAASAADSPGTIAFQPPVEIAVGGGERGPWQQNESRYDYVDDATIGIDERGMVSTAWVDQGRKDIFFQHVSPDGKLLGQPVNISRSPATFSWLPRLVVMPNARRKILVLWQEIIFSGGSHGGDILFARSDDGGKSFTKPVNLSSSLGGDGKGRINREIWHNGSLDLTVDTSGTIYAAWTEYAGTLWFSRSTNGGKSFSSPRRVAGSDSSPARAPSLAVGPGVVYLAWTVGENSAADIHFAKSSDSGASFAQPHLVAPSPGYSDAPKLAVDPKGVLHLVYAESSAGPFEQYHIRYTRSADGGRSFEAPREISKPVQKSVTSSAFPALDIDGEGNIFVIWELYTNHRQPPRGLGLMVSQDGGGSFTLPEAIPGSADPEGFNGSHQGLLMNKLAVNREGAVAIVNSSLKQGARSRVWLMRGRLAAGRK